MGVINTQGFIPVNSNVNLNLTLLPIESVLLKQAQSSVTIPLNHLEKINRIFQEGEILYKKASIGEISSVKAENQLNLFIDNLIQ